MTQNSEGVPEHLKTFAVAIFLLPDLSAGYAAAQLNGLNAMSLVGPRSRRGQVAVLNFQRQGKHSY